jgi:hypothetical protein
MAVRRAVDYPVGPVVSLWRSGVAVAFALAACAGCTGQNLYTTPRSLGDRGGQAVVAPQAVIRRKLPPSTCFVDGVDVCSSREGSPLPLLQAGYRMSLGERGEVGVHGGVDAWGVDGKWNTIRTHHFDLALLGRLSLGSALRTHHEEAKTRPGLLLQVPVLLGLNLGPITLVTSPGYTLVGDDGARLTHALRLGAGLQMRITSGFELMPEASVLHDVHGPLDLDTLTVGLGFLFPNLADHSSP